SDVETGYEDVIRLIKEMAKEYDIRFRDKSLQNKALEFVNHILLEVNWGQLIRQNVRYKVFISTIHSVKGLEFDYVLICGLENYTIPSHIICIHHCKNGKRLHAIGDTVTEALNLFYV